MRSFRYSSCVNFVFTVIVNFRLFENADCCRIGSRNFDLLTAALQRDIKFMYERPEQMNVDAIFGLTLAQVHVAAVLGHKNAIFLEEKNRRTLKEILLLCEIARVDGRNVSRASGLDTMIRPEIWNSTIFWRRGALGEKLFETLGHGTVTISTLVNQGTPSEAESLRCFFALIKQGESIGCEITKKCAEMLVRNDSTRGYPLTHRLLYVQAATSLGCEETLRVSSAELKRNFCSDILRDLLDLESMNFPSVSKDLAMEQIALCGMEGHLEFMEERYAKFILSWANSHGCFSAFGRNENAKKNRKKRSTSMMDHGCDTHASGVAAAALSSFVRSAVENRPAPKFSYIHQTFDEYKRA